MSEAKWDQRRYQELIDLHKAISLLSLEQVSSVLIDRLPSVFSIDYFTLFLYDKDKRKLNLMCHNHPEIESSFSIPLSSSPIMEAAILSCQSIREQNFSTSSYYRGADNPLFKKGYFVSIPLMIEKEIVGVLNINDVDQDPFNVNDLEFILNLSEFIAMSISNAILYEQTRKLAVTDGLTGISNRENMEKSLLSEFERSTRYNFPLSVILLDVDNFKEVNDTHGHQKGDEVLIAFGALLKKMCRSNDIAARYGGEEFLMVLPQSNAKGAFKIAERVREEIMKMSFAGDESNFSVTTSCGVVEFNKDSMKNIDQLVAFADRALYEAKNGGRNKTIIGYPEDKN
jgi:diguanylate cyclase (GGDEF)-like protein